MPDNRVQITIEAKGGGQAAQEFAKAVQGLQQVGSKASETASSLSSVTTELSSMAGSMAGLFAGVSFGAAARSIADIGMRMESLTAAFKAIAGGAVAGASELEFVKNEANRLGMEFETAAGSYKNLAASAKGTVLEGEKVREIFSAISEASAVLRLSNDQTGRAFAAVSQMISKGTVSSEELRQQLGEALPGAFQLAARAMGVTTSELSGMLEKGEVAANDFLPKLAKVLHDQNKGSVGDATNTAAGAINRLSNAFIHLGKHIYEWSEFGKGISWAADKLTGMVKLLDEAPRRLSAFARTFGQTLNLIEATKAASSKYAGQDALTWGGLKAYEQQQDTASTNAWKEASEKAGKLRADQEKWASDERARWARMTATAQEKYKYQVEILKSLYPYGGPEYEKGLSHLNAELQKELATQQAITGQKKQQSEISRAELENYRKYSDLAKQIASAYGIPHGIFSAMISQESKWDPRAVSPKGAKGLGQLMPETARSLGVTDVFDPFQNLRASADYLSQQFRRFGDWSLALAAYNAGPERVARSGGIPDIKETRNYVSSIMSQAGTDLSVDALKAHNDLMEEGRRIAGEYVSEQQKVSAELARLQYYLDYGAISQEEYNRAVEQVNSESMREHFTILDDGKRIYEDTRTEAEKYALELEHLKYLLQYGAISQETFTRAVKQMGSAASEMADFAKRAAQEIQSSLGDALYNVMSGKFDDIGDAFADMLMRMMSDLLSSQIMKWLAGSGWESGSFGGLFGSIFGGLFGSARGNVFSGHGIAAFENTIVSRPTLFPFAKGIGIMGEAGHEAIMPLTRTQSGDLGVRAVDDGSRKPMQVHIHEAPGTKARAEQDENGNLNVVIEQLEQAMTRRMSRGTGLSSYLDGRYRRRM